MSIKKKIVLKDEFWKPIEGHEDYEISSWGRVWSYKTNKFLKPSRDTGGYLQFFPDGRRESLHRLVAKAFVSNPDNHDTVDHMDFNVLNNHSGNLQWHSKLDSLRKKHNRTSPYLFVAFDRINKRWKCQMYKYRKWKYFETELEAAIQANFWIIELGLDYPLNQLNNDPIRISAPSLSSVIA